METIQRDYAPQGVKFYYVYKALAHPENNGYVQPFTLEERLLHVKEAEKRIRSQFTWLSDNMQNGLKHALGNAPNSEFIVDPEGKIVVQRRWSNPAELRADLVRLVGPVDQPTQLSEIDVRFTPPPAVAARGVVARLQLPGGSRPLKIEPQFSDEPFYVKLRAEVDQAFLDDGIGKLYLGFHLDPLYHVHWNNLVDPVRYRVQTSDGVTLVPRRGEGPRVDEPADVDPREFLLDMEHDRSDQDRFLRKRRQQLPDGPEQLLVKVDYFACNDEEGWCKPVSQQYVVTLELDADGGWAMSRRGNRGGRGNAARSPGRGGPSFPPAGRNPGVQDLPAGAERIMGGVFAVDAEKGTLTVRQRGGETITLALAADVPIVRNGQPAKLGDLQMRDMVMLILAPSGDNKSKVQRVMARAFSR